MHKILRYTTLYLCFLITPAAAEPPAEPDFNVAVSYLEQGFEHYNAGQFSDAISIWRQALPRLDTTKQATLIAETHLHIAAAYQVMGLYQEGLNQLNLALPITERIKEARLSAKWFNQLGNLYLASGNKDDAIVQLQLAVEQARKTSDDLLLASTLNSFANALWIAEFETDAIALYDESLSLALANKAPGTAVQIQINLSRIKLQRGNLAEVEQSLNKTVNTLTALPNNYDKANALTSLAVLAIQFHQQQASNKILRNAYDWLVQAKTIAQTLKNTRLLSFIVGYQGQLYEHQQRWSEAKRLSLQALFFAEQEQAKDMSYLWQWQLARIAKAEGTIDTALRWYRDAVDTLTPVRQELSNGYRRSGLFFQSKIKPVYLELVDLLLLQATNTGNIKQRQALLLEARNITETLKTAELEDYFRDECVIAAQEKATPLDQIGDDVAVLYPIILPDRLELLVSLAGTIYQKTISVDASRFNKTAYQFRTLAQLPTDQSYAVHARRLHRWLIEPIELLLAKNAVDTLIIVPDGALRSVPIAAIQDDSGYLVERYALGITPSLSLTAPRKLTTAKPTILLAGVSQAVQGFTPLTHVATELLNIQNTIGGTLLQDSQYTAANLSKALRRTEYSIVHLATHSVFGGSAKESYLLTFDAKLNMNDLERLLQISQFRDNAVELLTMSACETARGDDRAALGLAGIAIKASARSAMASLWLVNDLATSKLMSEFYRQLVQQSGKPGTSKAKALQNVQIASINKGEHPAFWASFLLIGNWL